MTKTPIFHSIRWAIALAVLIAMMNTGFSAENLRWMGVPESCYGTITGSGAVWHLPETETLEAADWARPFGNVKDEAASKGTFSAPNGVTLPIFRKLFTPADSKQVQTGKIVVAANAPFEVYFCGELLAKVMTATEKDVQFVTIDLAENFKKQGPDGPYAFDILTGYPMGNAQKINALKVAAKIDITYTDASEETILSDDSWTITNSPVLYYRSDASNQAGTGEIMDGDFWFRTVRYCSYAGAYSLPFSQMIIGNAVPVTSGPVKMKKAPQAKKVTEIKPKEVKQIGPNRWLADFGEEINGFCTAVFEDQLEGDLIRVRYASQLDANGMLADEGNSEQAVSLQYPDQKYSTDYHLFGKSEKPEPYAPRFVTRKFRYVEFSGIRRDKGPNEVLAKKIGK